MKINICDLTNEELIAYMLSISDEMRIRGMQKGCVEETYQRLQEENEGLKEQLCETKQFLKDDREEILKFCPQIEAYQLSGKEAKEIIAELEHKNKRLQEENKKLNKQIERLIRRKKYNCTCQECFDEGLYSGMMINRAKEYKQALEEIRNEIGDLKDINKLINLQKILDVINEVLNDRD